MREMLRAVLLMGLPVSVLLFLGAAAGYVWTDLPAGVLRVLAVLPVLAGALLSGCAAGRRGRKRVLASGAGAACLLTALWYLAAALHTGALCPPVLLLLTVPCGAAGAVWGAAGEPPQMRRRMHKLIPLRTRISMLPMLLHTPKQKPEDTE